VAVNPDELGKYITLNEGFRSKRYYDSKGIPTIGVGFNLQRPGAREAMGSVGADYDRVRSGKEDLSESQIGELLAADTKAAVGSARALFPDFDKYDQARQTVLADLAFNLGEAKLSTFKSFIDAVNATDWERAAKDLRNSKWYAEVGKRAVRNVESLRTGVPPLSVSSKSSSAVIGVEHGRP
jgi:GH24 family phage-related lysozyme (muramidase)